MLLDKTAKGSDLRKDRHQVSATKQRDITVEDVLMWEAT
jgi:hypothetical protein